MLSTSLLCLISVWCHTLKASQHTANSSQQPAGSSSRKQQEAAGSRKQQEAAAAAAAAVAAAALYMSLSSNQALQELVPHQTQRALSIASRTISRM